MRRLLIIMGVLLVGASVASGVISGDIIKGDIEAGNRAQATRLYRAQVAACHRQNVRQQTLNRNAQANYRYNKLFLLDIQGAPSRPQTVRQRAEIAVFAQKLRDDVDSLTWTPVVPDCGRHPTELELPVAFGRRSPQPADLPPRST